MFDNICSLPLTSDLFAQAIHPTEPVIAVGLASGHVQLYRLPQAGSESRISQDRTHPSNSGYGTIETSWRTRRHKGSCRSLVFDSHGSSLLSAGSDGLVKAASTETGQVISKIAVPQAMQKSSVDVPSLIHALTPQTLLLATDSSALHLYDLRVWDSAFADASPQQTHHPHSDYISSITPLPPSSDSTSGFSKQWVSTGGTTIAITDLRRGVLVQSEDQEEELLSSVFVGGLPKKKGGSHGEKLLVGGGNGVLTLWERGIWDDQDGRIIVDGFSKESLDTMAVIPDGVGKGRCVAIGLGDGRVKIVRLGINKTVAEMRHDEVDSVTGLGFEVGGRMISGGGQNVKIWHEKGQVDDGNANGDAASERKPTDGDDKDDSSRSEKESGSEEKDMGRKRRKRQKRKTRKAQMPHMIGFKEMD